MPDQLQLRGGTTVQHSTFTGASKEVTVDTTKKTVVVHDGSTAGGNPMLREDGSNSALALGSAGTPSLKFTGDTNTGIYSPGADQVAISTNGVGRLFVNASGQVGIGNASPNRALAVNSADAEQLVLTSTAGSLAGILFNPNGSTYTPFLGATGESLVAHTQGTERLRITSAGRVGIGTSAPQQALSISGAVQRNAVTFGTSGSPSEETGYIYKYEGASGTQAGIYFLNSHNSNNATWLSLKTTSSANVTSTALTIDSSQRVGIGTSSPQSIFHIGANAPANAGVKAYTALANSHEGFLFDYYYNTSASNQRVFDVVALGAGAGGAIGGSDIRFLTVPASATGTPLEAMRIDSAQRVGIGTTSPTVPLQVLNAGAGNNTNNGAINLCRTASVGSTLYHMYSAAVSDEAFAFSVHGGTTFSDTTYTKYLASAGGVHIWYGATNATERARIDSSGRLLVGTSSDSGGALFQVNGDRIRVGTAKTPASATATGTAGEICWDTSYIYVCTAANTWKRAALSTW